MPHQIQEDPPVTAVLEVFVERGKEDEFETRLRALAEASLRQAGHLGVSTLRPTAPNEPFRVIYKYDRRSNYDRWHASDERRVLFAAVQEHAASMQHQELSGLESWLEFDSPSGPPKWKSTLVSWFGIYPVAVAFSWSMERLGLHYGVFLRIFILSALVVPTTAYVVGPRMAHLLRGWLYPRSKPTPP